MLFDRWLTDYSNPSSFFAIAEVQGAFVRLDLREFGERFVFYYRRYEPEYVAAVRKLYTGGNFLDAGSNIGMYVVNMAPSVRAAGARIFSIEPVPSNLARQQVNVQINRCDDIVEYAPVVLGAEPGSTCMTGDFSAGNVNAMVATGGTERFAMTTLDLLAAERNWCGIGAMKLDVEGYEPAVLRGATRLLAENRPIILAEFNRERMAINGFTMAESWQLLKNLGYRAYALRNGNLCELSAPGDEENIFFLPEERAVFAPDAPQHAMAARR